MAGVNILHVPYKIGGGALNGLVGGEVQLSFLVAPAAILQVKAGKLKAMSSSPEQLVATVKADMVKWSKVIRDANIRAD